MAGSMVQSPHSPWSAGVEGVGLPHHITVALGLASILADGLYTAASNYSGTKAELDDRKRIIQVEERHIQVHRAGELEELRQILGLRELLGDVLDPATAAIVENKEKWIALMLTDEYGLTREAPHPLRSALATFGAFMIAGFVPLIPLVTGMNAAFQMSVWATLLTFFLIGTGTSRWSMAKWWWSGSETLLIGALAALRAYAVGGLFHPG